jgi:hypothetical protein
MSAENSALQSSNDMTAPTVVSDPAQTSDLPLVDPLDFSSHDANEVPAATHPTASRVYFLEAPEDEGASPKKRQVDAEMKNEESTSDLESPTIDDPNPSLDDGIRHETLRLASKVYRRASTTPFPTHTPTVDIHSTLHGSSKPQDTDTITSSPPSPSPDYTPLSDAALAQYLEDLSTLPSEEFLKKYENGEEGDPHHVEQPWFHAPSLRVTGEVDKRTVSAVVDAKESEKEGDREEDEEEATDEESVIEDILHSVPYQHSHQPSFHAQEHGTVHKR